MGKSTIDFGLKSGPDGTALDISVVPFRGTNLVLTLAPDLSCLFKST